MKKISTILFVMFLSIFSVGFNNKALASGINWNPDNKGINVTLSNGNLTASCIGGSNNNVKATQGYSAGKYYWEITVVQGTNQTIGICSSTFDVTGKMLGITKDSYSYYCMGDKFHQAAAFSYANKYTINDVISVALDLDNKTLKFYKNGVSQGTAFSDLPLGEYYAAASNNNLSNADTVTANFGATPFKYTIPNGYKAYDSNQTSLNTILNIEPEKNKIKLNETVSTSLTIDNIKDIAAEDIRIKYDNTKLQFLGATEVDGIKLVKNDAKDGELRFILASKGVANVVEAKKVLLKLNFKGIAAGDALVDVTKGRVSDGITMEKDLTDDQCGQATITIDNEALVDVNKDGQFTLLDLAIDGRHYSEDPTTLTQYNTDIVVNKAIDDNDLTKIGEYMLANPNYEPNKIK